MADAALIRDLRNAALTFQARTLETMLRYNPHSPVDAKRPGERSEPEKDPSDPLSTLNRLNSDPTGSLPAPREPSGNTQGNKGE